jgi:hypothetical protein
MMHLHSLFRQSALCVADDIIEHIGKESVSVAQKFLPAMIAYIQDANADVRQSAVYGIGIFSQRHAETFASFVPGD